jgi:lipoate-protein ligase B
MVIDSASAPSRTVHLHRADAVPYDHALRWQRASAAALAERRELGGSEVGELLALIQHDPVFTLGVRARAEHVLIPRAALEGRGARVVEVDRGGDVTFHGPGQLVGYPILDLRARAIRPVDYVRLLEQTLIDTLEAFDLRGERVRGRPGVWVAGAKVGAIGVRVQRGISWHGFALNVDTDLGWFDAIVPCGIADAEVTSIARLLGAAPPFEAVVDAYRLAFERRFASRLVPVEAPLVLEAGAAEAVPA